MIVYLITNKINGKRYVGQTVQTMTSRWSKHCSPSKASDGMPIVHAIQKYGKEAFEVKVLVECETIEEMNHRETYYIRILKTQTPNGYNVLPGGSNSRHTEETKKKIGEGNKGKHIGKKRTQEVKDKMSRDRKGKRRSPEVAKACSERVRGDKHPMFGKHHRDESKQQISKSLKGINTWTLGKKDSKETVEKKRIASTGRIPSLKTKQTLSRVNSSPNMEVLCHQTGALYRSTAEAARSLNLSRSKVKDVLKGRSKHTKGYTFEYTNKENCPKRKFKEKISIFCHQNGKTYFAILDAIKELNVSPPGVYKSLRTGRKTKGYSFEYVNKEDKK